MTHILALLRRSRALPAAVLSVVTMLGLLVLVSAGSATASKATGTSVAPPPAFPTSADQIQNIDQVRTAIKGYYGDTIDPERVNPIDGSTLHTFSPTGSYAAEMADIVAGAQKYLAHPRGHDHRIAPTSTKAVLFDVDDTTLNTYSYEIYSKFVYDPTSNAAFVNSGVFRAVPHMVDLEKYAESKGYTVFFLTGRPESQRAGTVANLTSENYDVINDNVYLKNPTADYLASCRPTCTTIQYKSLTRKLIESKGYDIVANLGDQFSDLTGGYADQTFKVPNPMYYLP